jgi:hypothetical protein
LQRSVEFPQRYRLIISGEMVENHTVDFWESTDFQEWLTLVGACFAAPPQVEHTARALKAF